MDNINLSKQCPELKEACWNVHVDVLNAKDVFDLYEIKWKYLDHERMGDAEKQLITQLTVEYGHGELCV